MNRNIPLIFILFKILQTESRVFCQDSNASPWRAMGYSCPVNCHNVASAVESIKMMDYKKLISDEILKHEIQYGDHIPLSHMNTSNNEFKKKEDIKKSNKEIILAYNNLLQNQNVVRDLKIEWRKMAGKEYFQNGSCGSLLKKAGMKPSALLNKMMMMKCGRRSNDMFRLFLKIFTELLNKYAHAQYKFTEEMTEVLLRKIMGDNPNLRHGDIDVSKLLAYLSAAIARHKSQETDVVIDLKSKNCLAVHVPGCFCKAGYVESSGQCVRPHDCFSDPRDAHFLARIILH